jgi:hypothetical protein
MEIKLKTSLSDVGTGIIVDEHGVLWNRVTPEAKHGIFLATTRGLNGVAIQGFYQNGTMFIVDLSEAKKYFSSMKSENCLDMHHM